MKRLLTGLVVLTAVAAALALGLSSVPHAFEEGEHMSASGMNANLDAVTDRLEAVSDSIDSSRFVVLDLVGRLDKVMPASAGASLAAVPGLQQARPRVEQGHVADPSVVNGFFDGYASGMGDADERTHALVEDLWALSARLTDAERTFGLPVQERIDTGMEEYAPPELVAFRRNARTVPGEMNANFTAVTTSLAPLERNAAEAAAWVEIERARLEAVEAAAGVGDPGGPGAGAVFQAAVGYLEPPAGYETVSYMLVLFSFKPESHGDVATVTVTGPPGWNLDQPFELDGGHRYGQGLHRALELPGWTYMLDGEYTVTAKVGTKEHTVTSTLDTSLRFPGIPGEEVYVDDVDEDGIHLNWNPVAGAVSYEVWYSDAETVEDFAPVTWVTRETSFTIPTPKSEINERTLDRYTMRVTPRNYDMDSVASVDFSTQPLESSINFRIAPWTRF